MAKDKDPHIKIKATDKTGKAFKSSQERMRNLASSAAILEGPLGKVAGRINAMGAALGRMSPLLLVSSVSIASLGVGMAVTTKAASALQQEMFKVNAVLEATGRAGELSGEQVLAFSRELGESTLTSATAVRGATSALATFKNIGTDKMQEVLTLAQDMSAVFGGDLRTNTIKLARALDNPREGLTGLSRNVLATSAAWRKYNADAFEAGKVSESQGQIIDAIKAKVAGAGTAEAGGLAGAADNLSERWTRAMENLGEGTPLRTATSLINGLAFALQGLNNYLEADNKAQENFTKLLEPNVALLKQYGISLDSLDPESPTQVNAVLKEMAENNVDLAKTANYSKFVGKFNEWEEAIADANETLAGLTGTSAKAQELREIEIASIATYKKNQEALNDEYKRSIMLVPKLQTLSATLRLENDKAIEQFTKKSQSKVEKAQAKLLELSAKNAQAGVGGLEKQKELETAYLEFVLSLHDKETEKAQTKADKLVLIETNRLEKMKQALRDSQAESGFEGPEQFDNAGPTPAELIDMELVVEQDKLDRKLALLVKNGEEVVAATALIEEQKKALVDDAEQQKRVLLEESKQAEINAKRSAIGHVAGLLKELGKENKVAAIAAIAISKGLAIAQVFAHTQVAAMAARAIDLTGATSAAIRVAGGISMAAIAATGIAQAGSIGSGGGGGGGAAALETKDEPPELADTRDRDSVTIQFVGDVYGWDEYIEERVIQGIQEAVDEKDLIIIGSGSRQAQEITG